MLEILDLLIAGFLQLLNAKIFAAMMLGIAIGFAVGILPGIGGPATLALLIPFTFSMDPFQAMALLLGMISVTGTAGDITAVLFGIPGETSSAATMVDGHCMAKNGEAGRALGAVLSASMVGGVFGALCLALGIIIVRPLVLSIGYAEFFMLSLAGITFMATLTGGAVIKGLCAGGLGLMLSMVGLDPVVGTQRFTFGQVFLWDGVGVLPMLLGLYAIPELIDMARIGASNIGKTVPKLSGVGQGVLDTLRHFWLVIRCSVIGTYVGLIPGMGATIGSWVAYGHAAQTAKERAKVGKGAVEGVLGPGAANNATMSGALIPTIGFGVPGSPQMAILLGAFIIHGLAPGPKMLMPESQGGHLTLTFTMVAIIIASNVIIALFCFLFLKQLARTTAIRPALLLPFILLLVYIGSFAEKNAFPDLMLTLGFGALGWAMIQFGWPRPPLILGVVLGPLIETNLFQAITSDGIAWLLRPSVLSIFTLIVASLLYPALRRKRTERSPAYEQGEGEAATTSPSRLSLMFCLGVAAVFVYALWTSREWVWQSRMIPWIIGFASLALVTTQAVLEYIRVQSGPSHSWRAALIGRSDKQVLLVLMVIVGSFVSIWALGFSLAVLMVPILYMRFSGKESWRLSLGLSISAFILFQLIFECLLHLPFPDGRLISWVDSYFGSEIADQLRAAFKLLCFFK